MPHNNRRYDRHYAWWRLFFSSLEHDISHQGQTLDISMHGLSFHCDYVVPANSKAHTRIYLPPCDFYPEPYELKVDTRVAYSILSGEAGFRTGLDFLKIHEDGASILKIKLANCPKIRTPGDIDDDEKEK